ncbi:hypothetical protein ACN469_11660 [Corallococcus terminator]
MTPLTPPPPDVIREEALRLRALLERFRPSYGPMRRDVPLGPEESAHLRAFWEVIGWSSLFADSVGDPELARGPGQAERYLKTWRSRGDGFQLTLSDLPRRFRLVETDTGGVGFSITDESEPDVTDPPVLGISANEGTVRPRFPGYLPCVGHALVLLGVGGWYSTTVVCKPEVETLPGLSRPFPFLSPSTVQLADAFWVVPERPFATSAGTRFAHARYEALIEWLAARHVEAVSLPKLPGTSWSLSVPLSELDVEAPGLTVLEGLEPGTSYRAGVWEGCEVLVAGRASGETWLAAHPRHGRSLQPALKARGWLP